MTPAAYSRKNKTWHSWIGKKGTVVVATLVKVASPKLAAFAPYSYCIVDFGSEKKSLMGIPGEILCAGDTVECVLRKLSSPSETGIIPYGIKVKKI